MLSVTSKARYDESVTEYEYRSHAPFTSTTFNSNDEVRITIQQQESFTHPSESYLHVTGKVSSLVHFAAVGQDPARDGEDNAFNLVNNGMAHLFDEIRYEIGGTVVDRVRNVGITTLLHALLSLTPSQESRLQSASWFGYGSNSHYTDFSFCVPLKQLMGFFEDYKKIVMNQKQELVILIASSFKNVVYKEAAAESAFTLMINSIHWRMPHVKVSDEYRLSLLNVLSEDKVLEMPFRSWELYEYPVLPQTTKQSWTIKTSSQLEKPRYVILAFQTGRKNDTRKDASMFDGCNLRDFKLFLNTEQYPYENVKGDLSLMYDMYAKFQTSYFNFRQEHPVCSFVKFKNNPIYVIDCSKQNDKLKVGPVDVRLEFEASTAFPAATTAYCLIIHDSLVEYSPLTGIVTRVH